MSWLGVMPAQAPARHKPAVHRTSPRRSAAHSDAAATTTVTLLRAAGIRRRAGGRVIGLAAGDRRGWAVLTHSRGVLLPCATTCSTNARAHTGICSENSATAAAAA